MTIAVYSGSLSKYLTSGNWTLTYISSVVLSGCKGYQCIFISTIWASIEIIFFSDNFTYKADQIHKMTTTFTQNGPRVSFCENRVHFLNLLCFTSSSFFVTLQSLTGKYREIPVMKTGTLQWEKGSPLMKTGFSLWELAHREFPVRVWAIQGLGLQWSLRKITWLNWQQPKTRGHVEHLKPKKYKKGQFWKL